MSDDSDPTDRIAHLVNRVEQLAADVATLIDTASGLADPIDFEPLAAVGERQRAMEASLARVRALVETVVDSMPASAEGSAEAPLTRADLDTAVDAIAEAVAARLANEHPAET